MRLEERQSRAAVADGGEIGRELGRMVRVAVEDGDAARLAFRLESASRSAELDDRGLGVGSRDAGELEGRERRSRVAPVVLARHREVELDGLELLGAHHVRHLAQPLLEERLDLGAGGERRVVVEVDVEQHGDLRPQRSHRAIRLVPLDDEPARVLRVRCRRAAARRRR